MSKTSFRCRLITPEAVVLDEQAVSAVLPAWDGSIGILPNRAALLTELGMGDLRIDFANHGSAPGGTREFFVENGFVQMLDNELTILAESAVGAEKIIEAEAEAELAAANARRLDTATPAEREQIHKQRRRAQAKVHAAKFFKTRGGY